MEFIIRPSGRGKTTDLIKRSAEENLYIVVANKKAAERVYCQAFHMGIVIPFPITFEEFLRHRYAGRNINGFLIDDVDLLLQRLAFGVSVKAASATEHLIVDEI